MRRSPLPEVKRSCHKYGLRSESDQERSVIAKSEPRLLDHLICSGKQTLRDGETEQFRRFEINDQFELRRLLYRQIGWLLALEDAASVYTELAEVAGRISAVSHQTTSSDVFAKLEHCGYAVANCQRGELFVFAE